LTTAVAPAVGEMTAETQKIIDAIKAQYDACPSGTLISDAVGMLGPWRSRQHLLGEHASQPMRASSEQESEASRSSAHEKKANEL
jgi:hypothetical protein